MSRFEDTVLRHLIEEHGADGIEVPDDEAVRRFSPFAVTASAAGLAAAAAGAVLLFSGTTDTPPAYALTPHSDGTDTLTLYRVTRGVSAVNVRLRSSEFQRPSSPSRGPAEHPPASFRRSR